MKIKNIHYCTLFFILMSCNTQKTAKTTTPPEIENKTIVSISKLSISDANQIKSMANTDIKANSVLLILQSPVNITFNDSVFQKQYHINYQKAGSASQKPEVIQIYNWTIFDFLNNKYGSEWTKTVRTDVIGFAEWKRYKK